MFRRINKKGAVVLGLVASLVVAAAAVAYFTSSGTGSGSGTVGSNTPLSTIQQTSTISGLTPGNGAQTVAYTIANAAGNGAQNLGKVTVSGISVTPASGKTCASSNFSANDPSSAVGTIAPGTTYTSASSTQPSVQMNDTGVNQDGCQGASLTLTLSAAQGS